METERAESPSANLQRADSALRLSIAKYGSNSYYYAHAPLPDAGQDAKKIEGPGLVTGGPPALLSSGRPEKEKLISAKEAAAAAYNGQRVAAAVTLKRYTWCDSQKAVKLYIHLENLRPGEESGGPFTNEKVAVEFGVDRVAIAIHRESGLYLLTVSKTYATVVPKDSFFVVADKKISIVLKKEEEGLTWFSLNKD